MSNAGVKRGGDHPQSCQGEHQDHFMVSCLLSLQMCSNVLIRPEMC